MLWEGVHQCLSLPRWNGLILRRTFPELEQSQIQRFRASVPSELYKWNGSKYIATFMNGSTLRFGYLATDDDVINYQSDEYGFIGFDELTHFSFHQWTYLTSRNRSTTGFRPNMAGATNPGGRGHVWVKKLWIEKKPAPGMEESAYNPSDYDFIPARVTDNPHIVNNDPDYIQKLKRLPAALRAALLDGSWDMNAGQFFDCWDPVKHVRDFVPQPWHSRWIGVDWGFSHDSAVMWGVTDESTSTVHVYRELVESRLTPQDLAREIVALSRGEKIDAIYLSPDAFAQRTSVHTIASEMGEILRKARMPAPMQAQNARVSGWMQLYDLLASGRLTIAPRCQRLIECLPSLQRDDLRPEDVMKQDGDDAGDALRYLIASRWRPSSTPRELLLKEKVTSSDPTMAMMQRRMAEAKLKGAGAKVISLHSRRRRIA